MTISKKEKIRKRVLDSLEKGKLSNDKGRVIYTRYRLTAKDRRHSGRVTPRIDQKGKISEMLENAENPEIYYDDWRDHRDGFRHESDLTQIRKKDGGYWNIEMEDRKLLNKKLNKQKEIRKLKRLKK